MEKGKNPDHAGGAQDSLEETGDGGSNSSAHTMSRLGTAVPADSRVAGDLPDPGDSSFGRFTLADRQIPKPLIPDPCRLPLWAQVELRALNSSSTPCCEASARFENRRISRFSSSYTKS